MSAKLPPIGPRWRERPPYDSRIVTVIGYTGDGRVRITTGVRVTTARADRFGGGRSGYVLVAEGRSDCQDEQR